MEYHDEHDYAMSTSETQTEEHLLGDESSSNNITYFFIPETQFDKLQSGTKVILQLPDVGFEINEVSLPTEYPEVDPHDVADEGTSTILSQPDTCPVPVQIASDAPIHAPFPDESIPPMEKIEDPPHEEQIVILPEKIEAEEVEQGLTPDRYSPSEEEIREVEFAQQVQRVVVSLPSDKKIVKRTVSSRRPYKTNEVRLDPCCVDCGKYFKTMKYMLEHVMREHPDSKPFKCEICGLRFLNLHAWKDHVKIHLDRQDNCPKRICESCGQSFPSVEDLRQHKINDHRHEHSRICLICGMGFKKPSSLRVHVDRHNGNASIQCDVCGKRFYRNADLRKHLRDAHEPNATRVCFHCSEEVKVADFYSHLRAHGPKPYTCQKCSESFARKVELKFHLKKAHPDYKRHSCCVCLEGFNEKYQLDRHMTEHTGLYKYPCPECGKGFTRKDQLDVHMVSHTGLPPYECDVCGKRFKRRDCLRSHKPIHSEGKPFHCELCKTSFVTKDRLKKHLDKYKDMEYFECNICQEKFHVEEHFEIHKVQEHCVEKIDEENPSFICSLCSKEYITKEFLIIHLKTHFVKKNANSKKYPRAKESKYSYSCEICSKEFRCKAYLTEHLTTHSGEKPHECLVCGKKFAKSKYLSEHKKTHKGNHVFECEICNKKYLDKRAYERHINQHTLHFSDESSTEGFNDTEEEIEEDNNS